MRRLSYREESAAVWIFGINSSILATTRFSSRFLLKNRASGAFLSRHGGEIVDYLLSERSRGSIFQEIRHQICECHSPHEILQELVSEML